MNLLRNFTRPPGVAMLIQLITDVDLILPLLKAAQFRRDLVASAFLIDRAVRQMPGLENTLSSSKIAFQTLSFDDVVSGRSPSLRPVAAFVSASESTANPHRAAHALTKRANDRGIRTYTLQHGFENIGLTYFDHVHTVQDIRFASEKILTWCPLERLHELTPVETKRKCVPVGCCKAALTPHAAVTRPGGGELLVTVFENLHWHRYDDNYRQNFLIDLGQTARTVPRVTFVVKPHPAGKWMTHRYKGCLPKADNVFIAHPEDPEWRPYSGPVLVALSDGIITTPSTVALDAARAGRPVAVVGYELNDLDCYRPLPIIRCSSDWSTFIEQLAGKAGTCEYERRASSFVADVTLPGDACTRILDLIADDLAGRSN